MRPSTFVVVPSVSVGPLAASTTSACWADAVRKRSTAITVRAPATARVASSVSGKSASGSAPRSTSTSILPSAAACRMPVASRPSSVGTFGQPMLLEPVAGLVEGDPTREQPGGETHVERSVHVAAAQGAQEPHVRVRRVDGGGGGHDPVGGLGDVGPAEHDGDGAVGEERPRRRHVVGMDAAHLHGGRARQQRPHHVTGGAGAVQERGGGELGDGGVVGGQLDDLHAVPRHGMPKPQEEDRELLLQVRCEQQHRAAGCAHLVDRGSREAEDDLGGETVTELRVDVVGAEDALGELGPRVGALVGEPSAAEHRDLVGRRGVEGGRSRRQRLAPWHLA